MNKNQKPNWDQFSQYFSTFNPIECGNDVQGKGLDRFVEHILHGDLPIKSFEKGNEFIIDIELPNEVDLSKIECEIREGSGKAHRTLMISLPKK